MSARDGGDFERCSPASTRVPRVVIVTRPTDLENLLGRHGKRDQVRFFLETRGQRIGEVETRHQVFCQALGSVLSAVPTRWRSTRITRDDLATFLFEPEDLVISVGQDGLVANVAKYLEGQIVLGVSSDPSRAEGVLARLSPQGVADALHDCLDARARIEERTMVEIELDDGQKLLALNEIFIGHRSHQSARYRIRFAEREERHSSSGIIVATGTGASGWARSIVRERRAVLEPPGATEAGLIFLVREAWPSKFTQTGVTEGRLGAGACLEVTSEMNDDGVIFGDGIEMDRLDFAWGVRARVALATRKLRLVTG